MDSISEKQSPTNETLRGPFILSTLTKFFSVILLTHIPRNQS